MDLEKKIIEMHRNSVFILILAAIIAIASIGVLFTTSARFSGLESAIVFINDDSLAQIQEDIISVNDNINIVNSNLEVLQDNLVLSINESCN